MKVFNLILILLFIISFSFCSDKNSQDSTSYQEKQFEKTTGISKDEMEKSKANINLSKKYPIKSGKITYERTGIIGTQKIVVYFDDYGIKERNETYNDDGSLAEVKFADGENMYQFGNMDKGTKVVYIIGPGTYGTEMKFDPQPFKNDEERGAKYNYEPLKSITILDKKCDVYKIKAPMGTTTFGGWNNFLLYSKTELSMGNSETTAVDFNENLDIDPGLFKVPEGYKVEKI